MNSTVAQLILRDRKIAYAVTDRDLTVVEVGGAVDILCNGYTNCLGRSLPDLVPELTGGEELLASVLSGELPRFELAWVNRETAEGHTTYLNIVHLPYRDPSGRIVGILHLAQDVTEMGIVDQQLAQHRNELRLLRDRLARRNLELEAANAELRRLDEMKSTFIAVAAHELRTPLAPIRGYVEVLLEEELGPLNDEQREYLEIVQRSVGRLLSTTNSLLDATRIEAGRMELVLRPTDLSALVETIAAECMPQLEAKAQHLTLRAAPDLPPVLGDEARAAQIVRNLLSNASKYTPQRGLISVSLALAEEEGFLQVSVADNGVGVPAEDRPKLFARFFRAGNAAQTSAAGAGLGLYITRSLVELHGGRIWFESEPGEGSTFYVTFPIADRPAPSSSIDRPEASASPAVSG
jgi:signal transduction histidine kinase